MATEYAVIDIGSNSIRYAEEREGGISEKEIFTTRLGLGLSRTGLLAESTMAASLCVIDRLARRARSAGLVPMAYATSAVRDAENGREFADEVFEKTGVAVEVLSGRQEAEYAFSAVSDLGHDAMLDIGGASMQIVTGSYAQSFRAGCVRCSDIAAEQLEKLGIDVYDHPKGLSPCDVEPLLQRRAVEAHMDSCVSLPEDIRPKSLVGVGGTITTLAALKTGLDRFDPAAVNAVILTGSDIEGFISRLIAMGAERRANPLLAARHDVILTGAYILAHALELLHVDRLSVSTRDGMEGYLSILKHRGARPE